MISETDYSDIKNISLLKERVEENRIPTLEETLHLAYFSGMCINIDLKEGIKNDILQILKENNIEVNCWTCNDSEDGEKLVECGVDYITSNILE